MIKSTHPDLESKISDMRILDHNPNKQVVLMANLCVVSGHVETESEAFVSQLQCIRGRGRKLERTIFSFLEQQQTKFQSSLKSDPQYQEAKEFIRSKAFRSYDYNPLLDSLKENSGYGRGDYFLVGHDFPTYIDIQAKVDEAYT
ncbi:unnamed protein product [Lactuca saligna]|uniref:Glycogen phosphorylase n=1 Tax=Lactuca saligna TaxID=75948 RepID=A0AA35UNM0_LACSI|nr:unnamed protein product [Lactuca saligna]